MRQNREVGTTSGASRTDSPSGAPRPRERRGRAERAARVSRWRPARASTGRMGERDLLAGTLDVDCDAFAVVLDLDLSVVDEDVLGR